MSLAAVAVTLCGMTPNTQDPTDVPCYCGSSDMLHDCDDVLIGRGFSEEQVRTYWLDLGFCRDCHAMAKDQDVFGRCEDCGDTLATTVEYAEAVAWDHHS